ncbi:MAG: translocation/assembly module TamB [Buchnera aphidicola (Brevicoryne brassicae)]|uniref:Translocation/assembly module TamB n=1 Tax=Buchnera aphidicola (Brevicoryne brassicae) TaxID=911343 RepID=A0AAJ5TXE4_9GAMM|nr:MAG: translocation/assembly module TamB [Buchnera aphidicola (Brevicoryne brassicae)]
MSLYHKYLSRFLVFFSVLFVVFLFFIESSIGFKWIFNLTNRFFLGIKVEEISGNWRNFTLKNISYNTFESSIEANSIHVILDIKSLFKSATIIKDIETKNLTISFKKNEDSHFLKKENCDNFFEKNKYIKYPIIFKNIHIDKILFKTSKEVMFLSNVLTGIEFSNNNITIFPSYIDNITVALSNNINLKKKFEKNYLITLKNFFNTTKIHNFLSFSSSEKKVFIPLNINLISLHCKKINFINYNNADCFEIKLKAKLKNNILKIKNIIENSDFLKIKSDGKIIFYNNHIISCIIHNKILAPRFHNRVFSIVFKAHLDKKIKFNLQYNDLYKMNITGTMFLDNFDDSFYLNLKSKCLLFSLKKDSLLNLKNFNLVLEGNINNYSLFIENIFKIKNMPSIFVKIDVKGSLTNVVIKNIKFFPIKKTIFKYEKNNLINNIIYNQHILELIGKTNVLGISDNNIHNMYFSKINLNGNIMKKKLSILGSFSYRNFNVLDIPEIKFFLGRNKLYLKGSLGKTFNINSSVYADNLDYFLSDLKGIIKFKSNIHGHYMFPIMMTSKTFGRNISIDNFYLKSFKTFTNINIKDKFLGKILLDVKKMYFSNFHIDSLYFKSIFNNKQQKLFLLLKSNILSLNLIVNGIYDNKTGNWRGFFKKINIETCLGTIIDKKNSLFFYYDLNFKKDNFFKKNLQKQTFFSSILFETKTSVSSFFNKSFTNFKAKLSINTQLKWVFGKNITNAKIFLTANDINLKRKTKEQIFSEDINCINLSVNFKKNNFKSQWILKKLINSTEKENISGYLNIMDIYNKKNIEGEFFISDFPVSFVNFLTRSFKKAKGIFKSNIVFSGTLYCPKVSANIFFQDISIKSDNILNYISFLFPYFLGKVDTLKINQSIIIKKADILFTLNTPSKKSTSIDSIEWNLLFKSEKIAIAIFPKIKIKFSSHLNLHYLLSKYDLIGYIKFGLFYFKINEKNFCF